MKNKSTSSPVINNEQLNGKLLTLHMRCVCNTYVHTKQTENFTINKRFAYAESVSIFSRDTIHEDYQSRRF